MYKSSIIFVWIIQNKQFYFPQNFLANGILLIKGVFQLESRELVDMFRTIDLSYFIAFAGHICPLLLQAMAISRERILTNFGIFGQNFLENGTKKSKITCFEIPKAYFSKFHKYT
jgi:hypothetical protein